MKRFALGTAIAVALAVLVWRLAVAQEPRPAYLQLAILDMDATRLDAFKVAAAEHAAAAGQAEPDLLALYAVSERDNPGRVRVLEIYANEAAYRAHLASSHYQTFASTIRPMLTDRRLLALQPVFIGTKSALPSSPQVRVAELDIAPQHLAAYTTAVREEIADSIRLEHGVIAIHATALASDPAKLMFLEIYADEAAYQSHIASPHFKKYVATTASFITGRRLMVTEPLVLYKKPQ
ncbi:hypothetical protein GCM10007242_14240 [Pigmentiphaga litoralis]|jgi:quinol monooxygenase YgiN|uniref:putative quinol monooxygenase n=1 Tax=Pigmentiphaga litoralis TaxID=516702 RepID=UPI001674F103|nr:antibiotic biosynthesis monooxygenase [Pigmentiphaga litoralis]GGX09432.1 hypothetical protein GCM10007242_14240 [Pigmentiphaga litoralis]